jgi:hypothetical protein
MRKAVPASSAGILSELATFSSFSAVRFRVRRRPFWYAELRSSDYPRHETVQSKFQDELSGGQQDRITFTGLPSEPDLVCVLRLNNDLPYGTVEVRVANHTPRNVYSDDLIRAAADVGTNSCPQPNHELDSPSDLDRILLGPIQGATDWRPRNLPGCTALEDLGDRALPAQQPAPPVQW